MIPARLNSRYPIAVILLSLVWAAALLKGQENGAPGSPAVLREARHEDTPRDQANYIQWLEERSMLHQAGEATSSLSPNGFEWRRPFAEPRPRKVVGESSVWILAYPGSVITRPGESVIAAWADPKLWDAFRELGIDLLHTGPVHRAGGIRERRYTPSVDGWFDPISLEIDPQLGTEEEYRRLVNVAEVHGGKIAGDLVPLHTGKGADFLLALRAYKDYPGMYVLVEIKKEDWGLLPAVDNPWESRPVPLQAARALRQKGYIPGVIHSNEASAGALELTGWDATGEVAGVDGRARRWVYLHFFKSGQPTLNWLHPSCAAQRVVGGDLVKNLYDRGVAGLRLDAVPFLGIEPVADDVATWHYQHPLSVWGTDYLAFLARRLGGWTFHELNVSLERLRVYTRNGPDLSYDFFTRTQVVHSLLIGDAALLRQAYRFLQQTGVEPVSLVHDLQNHDEITYQLVELEHRSDEIMTLDGREFTGRQLRQRILNEMRAKAAGLAAPHNRLYRPQRDGVATTFPGFVAASLGIVDPYHATPDQVEQIKRGHLLLAAANAMQPGVFSLSSWDLVGALPLPEASVADRLQDQDYRWINRGGVDLLGVNPEAARSAYGLPRAKALYGPLPEQLRDPNSFASRLKQMLEARRRYQIALGTLVAVPDVRHSSLCALVFKLPGNDAYAVTALNFGRHAVCEPIDLAALEKCGSRPVAGRKFFDAITGAVEGTIGEDRRVEIKLAPLAAKALILAR